MASHRFQGASGLDAFNGAVRDSLVSQVIEVPDPSAFRAALREVRIGRLRLVSAAVGALRAHRETPGPAVDGSVFLLLSTRARGSIGHRRGREPINPERLLVVPGREPFTVEYPDPARVLFVALPAAAVADRYPALDGYVRSVRLGPAARALSRQLPHLMSAAEAAGTAQPPELAAILDSTLHLTLRTAIGDTAGDPLVALRVAAERLVDEHLADTQLTVPWLADRLAVSVRQLHRAFGTAEVTAAEFVRRRRLEACARALLETPAVSVTELAHRYGFASASHLGALFRERYGAPPGRWRARHASDRGRAPG